MSEMLLRAVDYCVRAMNLIDSMSADERPADEIRGRLEKIVQSLRGFEKKAYLKTQKGNEAAREIEEAAVNLEKGLGSTDLSQVLNGLSTLEQRVEVLEKTIERMKRVVT